MILYNPFTLLFYITVIFALQSKDQVYTINNSFKYNLERPYETVELPSILNEVSGLTDIDNNHIACVQDELGVIFTVDIDNGNIKKCYNFEPFGDFEGLTHVNGSFYILRSDGRITIIPDYKKPDEKVHVKEHIPTKDNEGLCYDKKNNRLIVAAKSKPTKDSPYDRKNRLFYQFDIDNAELYPSPVFTLNVSDVITYAKKSNIGLPVSSESKKINFRPSSIAIHPVTQAVYIISADDFLLVICDQKGYITHMEALNPRLFTKAEGITFLPDNTMIISNEANNKTPTLLKFNYQDK